MVWRVKLGDPGDLASLEPLGRRSSGNPKIVRLAIIEGDHNSDRRNAGWSAMGDRAVQVGFQPWTVADVSVCDGAAHCGRLPEGAWGLHLVGLGLRFQPS